MKYVTIPKPTEEERRRIYETIFYFLVKDIEKTSDDVEQHLHALAMLSNTSSSQILLAASRITEPLKEPTKTDIAVTLAYLRMPIREISDKYIHHRTYYKHIYRYFDIESTEPRIFNRLEPEVDDEIIKLISYIRKTFDAYDIAKRGIVYDAE